MSEATNMRWWEDQDHPQVGPEPRAQHEWDRAYLRIAGQMAQMSKCASRQIAAVIVVDNRIVAAGYNGAPPGVDLCQRRDAECPRQTLGLPSGQRLDLCPAVHAEVNAIATAARTGTPIAGGTMYAYCTVPCATCAGAIIAAGIKRVVCLTEPIYHDLSVPMFGMAGVLMNCYSRERVDGGE